MNITLTCPACPEKLTIPVSITTKPGSSRRAEHGRGITIDIAADITDEGRQIIADHTAERHADSQ